MSAAHEEVQNYGNAENTHFNSTENADADLDLENAIGDAFKQFAMFEPQHNNVENNSHAPNHNNEDMATKESPYLESHTNNDNPDANSASSDTDLENVIGNVFSSLTNQNEPEVSHDMQSANAETVKESINVGINNQISENAETDIDLATVLKAAAEDISANVSSYSDTTSNDVPKYDAPLPSETREIQNKEKYGENQSNSEPRVSSTELAHQDNVASNSNSRGTHDPLSLPPNEETSHGESQNQHTNTEKYVLYNPPQISTVPNEAQTEAQTGHENQGEGNFDDNDLENAIGDAFKNLVGGMDTVSTATENESGSKEQENHSNQATREATEDLETVKTDENHVTLSERGDENTTADTESSSGTDSEQNEDTNLEDAIGAALKSLAGEFDTSRSSNSDNVQASEVKSPEVATSKDDTEFDLGDIVKNVVSQIAGLDNTSSLPQASEVPAQKVTENVSGESGPSNHPRSTTEDYSSIQELDAALKSAVANAVKSAFPQENTSAPTPARQASIAEKNSDIEQLQMNEILQNAFNMAMQNPQELLTTLDKAEDASVRAQKDDGIQDPAQAMDKAITELFVSEIEESKNTEKSTTEGPKKPLSIAETLALHRANMSAESQRDYSIINSLEDSVRCEERSGSGSTQNHPQLSTILSSLSQHIQSGTQSSTLMSVIRQMTNALMHNKKYPASFSKGGQEIIRSMKNSEDRNYYIGQLRRAKRFVQECVEDASKVRAVALLENILESLEAKKSKNSAPSTVPAIEDDDHVALDACMQYYESARSTLTNLDVSRLELAMSGVKFDVDSNEHKSRVREGNRERKKKWREENAERNKDNDLRCRVLKRAALKFGEISSDEKTQWIEREYDKRKTRRINRQKKNEVKPDTSPAQEEPPVQDPLFVTRLTESFNLVAECGVDDESRAVMVAVCALAAVVAASCAQILGMQIYTISPAVSQILTSIYDSGMRAGGSRKFLFLLKTDDSLAKAHNMEVSKEEILRRLAVLKGLDASGSQGLSATSALDVLRDSQKRLGLGVLERQTKRLKSGTGTTATVQEPDQSQHMEESSVPSSDWYSASNLKMPSYKTPQQPTTVTDPELFRLDNTRRDHVERIPKIASPFISNKFDNDASASLASKSVKKPGSLQRPVFSRPANRGASLGFPTLYSTSFKSN